MKVLYGLRNERYEKKFRWFLSLTPTQRYIRMLEIASFSKLNHRDIKRYDKRASKAVQILKQI